VVAAVTLLQQDKVRTVSAAVEAKRAESASKNIQL